MSKQINQAYLEAVKYGDMENEFKKLGIAEVWEPGKRKADMVQEALQKLRDLKELKEQGLENEALEKELKKIEIQREKNKEEAAKTAAKLEKEKEKKETKEELEKIRKSGLTKENIDKGLKNVNAQLKNRPSESYRLKLLAKKKYLMNALEEL